MSTPLQILFNKSLEEGVVPQSWKYANVLPIHKKGSKQLADNYRPISLTSVLSKILEKLVKESILTHLLSYNLLSKEQFGFRNRRSCILQLLEVMDSWTALLDDGQPVDVIYLDFKKAFDTVPHQRLLKKLSAYGFRGNLLTWLEDFICNRFQRVKIGDSFSEWSQILSGVPQGSVLGPMLFLVYINDLPDALISCIKLFADDTKLYSSVSSNTNIDLLESDLQSLMNWSGDWDMEFNASKCSVLHLGNKNIIHKYKCSSQGVIVELANSSSERDLGIVMDSKLDFGCHINNIVNKANRQLGLLKRSFVIRDRHSMLMLYKSTIRPLLEYGSVVWSPWKVKYIDKIEQVQRRFSKLVSGTQGMPYEQRLEFLNLDSLAHRRQRESLIQVYKLLNNYYDIDYSVFFEKSDIVATRGNSMKLKTIRSKLKLRSNFFSVKAVSLWNSLPEKIVSSSTLNQFKSNLSKHFKDKHISHSD
jgi:hypothetical protein